MRRLALWLAVGLTLTIGIAAAPQRAAAPAPAALTADALFQPTKIWTIHLTLPNDEFSALVPMPAPAPAPPQVVVQAVRPAAGPTGAAGAPPPPPPPPQPMQVPSVLSPAMLKQLAAGQFVGPEGGRNGISATRGLDFQYVHAALDFEGTKFADVAVRPKGNGTYTAVLNGKVQKPSLKIDINKFVKGQKLAGLTTINLHNSIFDASWMNEPLAFRLYREAGVPAPRTAYARVYVTAKGGEANRYLGLYQLVENVDTTFTESRFNVAGGALYKPVTVLPFKYFGQDWKDYNQMYDPKTDVTAADKQRVIDFSQLLATATDDAFAAKVGEFIDLTAFAKYMAVVAWMANPDSVLDAGQNYYVWLNPSTKRFVFLPWDQDHSWGQFLPWRTVESQQQLDVLHPWAERFAGAPFEAQAKNDLLGRIFTLDAFKRPYLAALLAVTKLTQPERIAKQIDDLTPLIEPLVPLEPKDARVTQFKDAVGVSTFKRPFNQSSPEINSIKIFVPARQASVLAQLKALGVQ